MATTENTREKKPAMTEELLAAYRQMLVILFFASLALTTMVTFPLLIAEYYRKINLSILIYVAAAGALGSFFSALTRLYSLEQLPAALVRPDLKLGHWYLLMYALIPPIVGIIGAVFIYVCLASGLVSGQMFQKFKCASDGSNCDSLVGLLSYSPDTVTDYAKSLVWGFVSGFSERLVPDALRRLESSKVSS